MRSDVARTLVCVLAGWLVGCGASGAAAPGSSPYAGNSSALIPSLTTQEVEDLLAGRGLGMARAAELNGYPGPRHVLDLQSQLGLNDETVAAAEALFEEMKAEAQPLGARVVDLEKELGELYASRTINETVLPQKVDDLASIMGQLRVAHLRAHIKMTALLTPQQIERYRQLRGYSPRATQTPVRAEAQPVAGSSADPHSAHHGG